MRSCGAGIPVSIKVAPYPDDRFAGEVYFVVADARPERRGASSSRPGCRTRTAACGPGCSPTIEVELAQRENALVVPESALVYDPDGTFVWRIDAESRAQRVPVELGLRQDGRVEVAQGLAAGDLVVSAGTTR